MDCRQYYSTLGIPENVDYEQIKKAYWVLALKHHPDRNKSPLAHGIMVNINAAFEVLSDNEKRRQYHDLCSDESNGNYHNNSYTNSYADDDDANNQSNQNEEYDSERASDYDFNSGDSENAHSYNRSQYYERNGYDNTSSSKYDSGSNSTSVILIVGFILVILISFGAILAFTTFTLNRGAEMTTEVSPIIGTTTNNYSDRTSSSITALSQSITIFNNESRNIILAADGSSQSAYYLADIVTYPLHGTLAFISENINGSTVTYTPASYYTGHDSFKFVIRNYVTNKMSNIGTVSIIISHTLAHSNYPNKLEYERWLLHG